MACGARVDDEQVRSARLLLPDEKGSLGRLARCVARRVGRIIERSGPIAPCRTRQRRYKTGTSARARAGTRVHSEGRETA
jgi:hypothetical protein